jgi:hypothetical protein
LYTVGERIHCAGEQKENLMLINCDGRTKYAKVHQFTVKNMFYRNMYLFAPDICTRILMAILLIVAKTKTDYQHGMDKYIVVCS